jgi:hypothetical protein
LERVELLAAFSTSPEFANRGRRFAVRAGEAIAARKLCELRQSLRLFQAAPATHQHEESDRTQPDILPPQRQTDETNDAYQSDDCSDHQTASAPKHKPEQGAEDLAAVEGINGQDIENQQAEVDE